jgi:hypothetical protein
MSMNEHTQIIIFHRHIFVTRIKQSQQHRIEYTPILIPQFKRLFKLY